MINIEQVAKINNSIYFFVENKKDALSASEIKVLMDIGCVNITEAQFNKIIKL